MPPLIPAARVDARPYSNCTIQCEASPGVGVGNRAVTGYATAAEDKSPFGLKRAMIVQEHWLRAQQSALARSAISKIKEVTPRFCALQSRAIYASYKVNGNHNDAKNQQR